MPGCAEHGLGRVAVQAPRPDLGAQLARGIVRRARRPVRPGLPHRLIRVRRPEHASGL